MGDFNPSDLYIWPMTVVIDRTARHPEKAHRPDQESPRKPDWIRVKAPVSREYAATKAVVREHHLHTVCEEAACPNIGECWTKAHATMMIMGDTCTRACAFCNVKTGLPGALDAEEPANVAAAVKKLGLRHVVVTSVDRDDLPDGGAGHFAETARAIKALLPGCRVEVLVPDFRGDLGSVDAVTAAPIDVLNHNVETVPRLYRRVRAGARYDRSLAVLGRARVRRPGGLTKTGLMLGLGERQDELISVFSDLRAIDCDILTLGQYLRPSAAHLPVDRYVPPEEFEALGAEARSMGFRHVEAGPLVRSSYHAWSHVP